MEVNLVNKAENSSCFEVYFVIATNYPTQEYGTITHGYDSFEVSWIHAGSKKKYVDEKSVAAYKYSKVPK